MDALIDWAKNIVYFILFIKLLTNLIPNGNMSKYIKLFTGILLMIVLMQPILTLKTMNEKVLDPMNEINKVLAKDEFSSQTKTYSSLNKTLALNLYKKKMEAQIQSIVQEENAEVVFIELKINEEEGQDYGDLLEIQLKVVHKDEEIKSKVAKIEIDTSDAYSGTKAEDIILEKNIKNTLHGFYNVPIANMNISIE